MQVMMKVTCPHTLCLIGCFFTLLTLQHISAQSSTDVCPPTYSFVYRAYTYHVITDCVGSNDNAVSNCSALNGALATARFDEVLEIISNYLFYGIKIPWEEDASTGQTLVRRKRDSSSSSSSSDNNNSPPVVHVPPEAQQETAAETQSSETQPPETQAPELATTTAYPYLRFQYWTQPFVVLPGFDTGYIRSGTCSTLTFEERPISDSPLIFMDIVNDCEIESQSRKISWICETLSGKYSLELPPSWVKREVKTVMDNRRSAVMIGATGIAVFVTLFTTITLLDLSRFIIFLRKRRLFNKKYSRTEPILDNISQNTETTDISSERVTSEGPGDEYRY